MKKIGCSFPQLLFTMSVIVTVPAISNAQTGNTSPDMSAGSSMVMSDTAFIRKNIMDNMTEIQLSQLGKQKSTNPQIKTVSQQMVTDHTMILNDLKRIARQKNMSDISSGTGSNSMGSTTSGAPASASDMNAASGTSGTNMSSPAGGTTSTSGTTGGNSTSGSASGSGSTGMSSGTGTNSASDSGTGTNSATSTAVQHDMQGTHGAQEMAGMQALQNASGTEFNNLFITQMLQMHQAKIAELQTASTRITDPVLKAAVVKALPKIKMHTATLARINKAINGNGQ